jgi:hypothetical protein
MDQIAAYNKKVPAAHRPIVDTLLREISGALKTKAEAKVWHAIPVWFVDDNPVVGYKAWPKHVTLLFWNGKNFDEPGLIPAGKFKAAEIKYTAADQIKVTDLRRWLKKAGRDVWDYRGMRASCR